MSGSTVGGLLGRNYKGTVHNTYTRASLTAVGQKVGGLIGSNEEGTVTGANYYVQKSGRTDGIGSGNACSQDAVCEHKSSTDLGSITSVSQWLAAAWSFDESDSQSNRLPALRYTENPLPSGSAPNRWCDNQPNTPSCGALIGSQPFLAPFDSGEGTEQSPFVIKNYEQLNNVRYYKSGNHFILANDIDASPSRSEGADGCTVYDGQTEPNSASCSGWKPIGCSVCESGSGGSFEGSFDGKGFAVSNLYIYRPNTNEIGLFASTSGVSFHNIGLKNIDITGQVSVGGLAGWLRHGNITNSYVTGDVTGKWRVGGLVGVMTGNITNSYAAGNVTGGRYVGGLVGLMTGNITNSYATGNVTGGIVCVGGLAGFMWGSITNSHTLGNVTGNVAGNGSVGGLAGWLGNGIITNSYAAGMLLEMRMSVD